MKGEPETSENGKLLQLNAEKFEFLLIALEKLVEPLKGREKYRVTLEKDPASRNITIMYHFE